MTAKYLIDTNLLVYAYDRSEPVKRELAIRLLDDLVSSGEGALSTQILAEFFVATTRRIAIPLTQKEAAERLATFIRVWPVLSLTPAIVKEATRGTNLYRMHYYDAQIWATAYLHEINVVLSEDFSHLSEIENVRFLNPFMEPPRLQ